jgi:hypothetical protein
MYQLMNHLPQAGGIPPNRHPGLHPAPWNEEYGVIMDTFEACG